MRTSAGIATIRRAKWSLFGLTLPLAPPSVATIIGVIDGSVAISYAIHIDSANWHEMTLAVKLLLAFFFLRKDVKIGQVPAIFLAVTFLLIAVGIAQYWDIMVFARPFSFLMHLMLTLLFVRAENIRQYTRAFGTFICSMAVLHIYQCLMNIVPNEYGRYLYLGGSHPNLGGEINSIASFALAWGMRRRLALPMLAIFICDELFMQDRSSLLVSSVLFFVVTIFDDRRKLQLKRTIYLSSLLCFVVVGVVLMGYGDTIWSAVTEALHLNDPYRGLGTGASGRSELWDFAIYLFEQSPIIGMGWGYFETINHAGAHNIFLYALAQNGIFGLLPLIIIIYCMYMLAKKSAYVACIELSVVPLFLFNDRYMNINPYPFVLYVILLVSVEPPGAAISVAKQLAASVRNRVAGARPRGVSRQGSVPTQRWRN